MLVASAVLSPVAAPGAEPRGETIKRAASVMGTDLEATFYGIDAKEADRAFKAVVAEFRRIDRELSEWKGNTYVSEINKNAGSAPVVVPPELFKIISAAMTVSGITDGAFDITWASLWGLWDFSPGSHKVPDPAEVKRRLKNVNYRDVALDAGKKSVMLKRPGMAMGLGGIAKGYAVDSAMSILDGMGIKNVIIKAGGDMRVQGSAGEKTWEIGIRHPRKKDKLLATVPLKDVSISTSGDYERFFMKDGVLYHHIIDPRTGYPARGCRSVTIVGPDTTTTDALSTAVFVMGPEKGLALVERLKGIEAIIVDSTGGVSVSRGFKDSGIER